MVDLDPQTVALLAVVSGVVACVALVMVAVLTLRLRAERGSQQDVVHGSNGSNGSADGGVARSLARHDAELAALRRDVRTVHTNTEHLRELVRETVSRVALVRYDAFDDMGGALSFSAALLDERGDGVVVSAINGRTETRCYAKSIVDGRSDHSLSREEEAVIVAAIERRGSAMLPPQSRRRRRRAS